MSCLLCREGCDHCTPGATPDRWQGCTASQRASVRRGLHPLGHPLRGAPEGETRGTCAHLRRHRGASTTYLKCRLTRQTFGPATDTRSRWPACARWEPNTGETP